MKKINKWNYYYFKNINNIYEYIHYVNQNKNLSNILNKKNLILLLRSKFMIFNLKKIEWFKFSKPLFFIWNANISIEGDIKRYSWLAFIRNKFVKKPLHSIISNIMPILPIITKEHFFRSFLSWYMSINRKEPKTYNLNNISIYCNELNLFIKYLAKFNLILYKKFKYFFIFYKYWKKRNLKNLKEVNVLLKSYIKYILKVIKLTINKKYFNRYKFLKYKRKSQKLLNLIFKKYKFKEYIFLKRLSYIMIFIRVYLKFNNFYVKYINKLGYIYNKFLNVKKITNIKYLNFSFYLKLKKKKRNIYKASKNINLIYYINKIIFQFIYYIFISWMNLYITINNNNRYLFFNLIKKNNANYLILINIYKYYLDRKYRKIFKKINFLNTLKTNIFLLYYKNINFYKTDQYII